MMLSDGLSYNFKFNYGPRGSTSVYRCGSHVDSNIYIRLVTRVDEEGSASVSLHESHVHKELKFDYFEEHDPQACGLACIFVLTQTDDHFCFPLLYSGTITSADLLKSRLESYVRYKAAGEI